MNRMSMDAPRRGAPAKQEPALDLPLDKVTFIILKAREYDVKEADADPNEGSNPTDDGQTDVLEDNGDDPVREELLAAIAGLNEDERMRLIADSSGVGFIDLFEFTNAPLCDDAEYLCDDGFHPNDFGYAEIAQRAYPALESAVDRLFSA